MNVRSRAARAAVLGIAALTLASCSDVHPGSAAVVDGKTITMEKVDDAATAYCQLALAVASQQGVTAVSKADSRRQTVTDLITLEVARTLIRERDLKVDSKSFAITADQEAQILQAFPGENHAQITTAIANSQEVYAIIVALGEEASGKKLSEANTEEIEAAGQKQIEQAVKDADVEVDPRFGLDDAAQQVSIPASTEDVNPAKLPAFQRCS